MKTLWTPLVQFTFPSPSNDMSKSKQWRTNIFVLLSTNACTLSNLLASSEILVPSANLYLPFAMNEQLNIQEIMKSNGLYVFLNSLDYPCPFMQI
jgi:hypothetical protein